MRNLASEFFFLLCWNENWKIIIFEKWKNTPLSPTKKETSSSKE